MDRHMNSDNEKIEVRVTSSGQRLQVVVLNKGLDVIQISLGEGVQSVRCSLTLTRNGAAYVDSAMGREAVYERSREQVQADLARAAAFREFRR
jgi:K+/H+ antiporter YhaU regulatory subunit KhtT